MITLDGDACEGGGQILRVALALSAALGKPFRILDIRRRRPKPGLKPQHLAGVRVLARNTCAEVEGDEVGSRHLRFEPGPLRGGLWRAEIGTAGSLTLLLQALLLPALFAPGQVRLELVGGTDVRWSPPADALSSRILPYWNRLGRVRERVAQRGYHPPGGGRIEVDVGERGFGAAPLQLEGPWKPQILRGVSSASEHLRSRRVAERMSEAARQHLEACLPGLPVVLKDVYEPSISPGCALVLWAEGPCASGQTARPGADALGERGLPAEEVGLRAARQLVERLGTRRPVDSHQADQLLLPLALLGGILECEETSQHARAVLYVLEAFCGPLARVEGRRIAVERPPDLAQGPR